MRNPKQGYMTGFKIFCNQYRFKVIEDHPGLSDKVIILDLSTSIRLNLY